MATFFTTIPTRWLCIFLIIACIPAFLIHLPLIAFIGDEGIRTLVAFEMHQSGNYIVPTLNGEPYYNKPPLYNWCIIVISSLLGGFGEWPTRITSLLCLGLFAWWVYQSYRRYINREAGIVLAFMLLTSGRILFWDSMLGLIDIGFSAIIFLQMMTMYRYGHQKKWIGLVGWSVFLFSIAFMLKGLPAVVFLGLSFMACWWFFQIPVRKIITIKSFGVGLLALMPLLIYYVAYAQQVSLDTVFGTLTDQSMQRTATHHGAGKTIAHIFTFPVEQLYHFLPWSVLIFILLRPSSRKVLRQHPFLSFTALMFAVNIPVYWLSVQVYPRYLLMFVPLLHGIVYYLIMEISSRQSSWYRGFHIFFAVIAGLATLAIMSLPFFTQAKVLPYWMMIWIFGSMAMLFCLAGLITDRIRMFWWMCLAVLVVRILFNLIILPLRAETFPENDCRKSCREVALQHGTSPWYIYGETEVHQVARCYTSLYTDQVIRKTGNMHDPAGLYIVDPKEYASLRGDIVDTLILERRQKVWLMRPE